MQLSRELLGVVTAIWVREFLDRPFTYTILRFYVTDEDISFLMYDNFLCSVSMGGYNYIVPTDKGKRAVRATSYLGLVMACVDGGLVHVATDLFKYLHSSELCTFLVSGDDHLRQMAVASLKGRGKC